MAAECVRRPATALGLGITRFRGNVGRPTRAPNASSFVTTGSANGAGAPLTSPSRG